MMSVGESNIAKINGGSLGVNLVKMRVENT